MANLRVSELQPIYWYDVQSQDLLLLADVSVQQSKKLTIGDLQEYLNISELTGALNGTSSWAITASYALFAPAPISVSYASSSTWTYQAITSSYALSALSSSYSFSGSYALTASYAVTCSIQIANTASFSAYSQTASYLLYTPGVGNGTASFALTSSLSTTALTSSYSEGNLIVSSGSNVVSLILQGRNFGGQSITMSSTPAGLVISSNVFGEDFTGTAFVGTASYASQSLSSSYAITSSYIITSSYAITSSFVNTSLYSVNLLKPMLYGIYNATQAQTTASSIGITVVPTIPTYSPTVITAYGTALLPYSSSASGSLSLIIIGNAGYNTTLDTISMSFSAFSVSPVSGTLQVPFSLVGESNLIGTYTVSVSASNVIMDLTRPVKFRLETQAETLYTF